MKLDYGVIKSLSLISQVGFMMATPIIGCIILGSYLDRILQTKILFLIIFTILGVMAAFRNLYFFSIKKSSFGKKDNKK